MVTPSTLQPCSAKTRIGALGVVQDLGPVGVGEPGGEGPLVGLVQLGRVEPGGRPRRPRRARPRRPLPVPSAQVSTVATPSGSRAVLGQPAGQLAGAEHRAVQLDAGRGDRGASASSAPGSTASSRSRRLRVADLQGVQDHRERPCGRTAARSRSVTAFGQLHVAHHLGEPAVELDGLQVVAEVLPGLALDLLDALDQLRERTELVDPLRGGLLADAGDAGEVVGRVAAQRREVRVLRRASGRTSRRPSPG